MKFDPDSQSTSEPQPTASSGVDPAVHRDVDLRRPLPSALQREEIYALRVDSVLSRVEGVRAQLRQYQQAGMGEDAREKFATEEWSKLRELVFGQTRELRSGVEAKFLELGGRHPGLMLIPEELSDKDGQTHTQYTGPGSHAVLALDELVNNALEHDLLGLPSKERSSKRTHIERFFDLEPSPGGVEFVLNVDTDPEGGQRLTLLRRPVTAALGEQISATFSKPHEDLLADLDAECNRGLFLVRMTFPTVLYHANSGTLEYVKPLETDAA